MGWESGQDDSVFGLLILLMCYVLRRLVSNFYAYSYLLNINSFQYDPMQTYLTAPASAAQ